jgi:hypothetical protein
MVDGDIWANPLVPDAGPALAEGPTLFATSNGLAVGWPKPVLADEDDFDEVSDCSASRADAATPRAGNMAELQCRNLAANNFAPKHQQAACHLKTPVKLRFPVQLTAKCPGN